MCSSLKDLSFIKSRKEFVEYYNRCLVFNIPICEGVRFSVGKFNNIGVDISGLKEEEVVIPPFVNYIYREDLAHTKVNYWIKKLDLCNVNTISDYGLGEFRQLEEVKGIKLEGISDSAFYDCCSLKTLDCNNIKAIGACGLYHCSELVEFKLPELKHTKQGWCSYSGLKKLYAPKLIKLETLEFVNTRILDLSLGSDTIIQQQFPSIKFRINNNIVNWTGLPQIAHFSDYKNYMDKGLIKKSSKYGYYTTWDAVLNANNLSV